MSKTDLDSLKRIRRNQAIEDLISQATAKGDCTDRMYWTLIYDFEHAAMTTNLEQLQEIGIFPVMLDQLTQQETAEALALIINGLAKLGIFLLHTNHLTDGELYERLVMKILAEPVRDLPPDSGVHEFIDITGGQPEVEVVEICNRDAGLPKPKEAVAA